MTIKEIDFIEYLIIFKKFKTALADFYFKRYKDVTIIGAYDSDEPVGILFLHINSEKSKILHINVLNNNGDVYSSLIKFVINKLLDKSKLLEWCIVSNNDKFEVENKCANNFKFYCYDTLNIFRHENSDKEKALAFVEENRNISDWFLKKGYIIKSFAELSKEQLDYISNDPDKQFSPTLRINNFINIDSMNLCKDKSFVCLKNDKIIAFASVSSASKGKYIYDTTCVSKDYKMSGVFVPVNNAVFDAIFKSNYDLLVFAVYDSNKEMLPVFNKWLMPIITNSVKQLNYIRPIKIDDDTKWDEYCDKVKSSNF